MSMPTQSGKRLIDGFISGLGGMNQGLDPSLISPQQYAFGLNIQNRSGLIKTRPGWIEVFRIHQDANKFQGCGTYVLSGITRLIYAIGGSVYSLNMSTGVTRLAGTLSSYAAKIYTCQADRFFVVQDGLSIPLVLWGDTTVTSTSSPYKLPTPNPMRVGTIMAYGQGRLFTVPSYYTDNNSYSSSGKAYFVAGDIFKAKDPMNIFNFLEDPTNNLMGLPMELGYITGMAFLRNSATGTGLGPLMVFAHEGVSAFDVMLPRPDWNPSSVTKGSSFSRVLFYGPGSLSDRSIISQGNDILYRSDDGIRSIRYTQAEATNNLANVSMSAEVYDLMKYENDAELALVSSDFVDNKFYVTVNYDPITASFQGLVSLDFANINQFGKVGPPSYDGLYSGFSIKQLFSARYNDDDSLFALLVDQGELSVSALANAYGNQDQVGNRIFPLKSRVYTKSFDFLNPFSEKKVVYVELWLKDIIGVADVNIYWRTEGYPLWCLATTSHIVGTTSGEPKEMPRMRMVLPVDFSDPTSFDGMNRATTFQFCIEITGSATIGKFSVHGDVISEQPNSCVQETDAIPLLPSPTAGCEIVDFYNSYS